MTLMNLQTGDRNEFEERVMPLTPQLHRHALRLCQNEALADDLVQDTVIRAWRFWPGFRAGSNLSAWLYRILSNTFLTECRKASRSRRLREAVLEQAVQEPVSTVFADDDGFADEVVGALARLPPGFAEVLLCVDVDQLSYADTAHRLGCPVGTVMSRLHRARHSMRALLQDPDVPASPPASGRARVGRAGSALAASHFAPGLAAEGVESRRAFSV